MSKNKSKINFRISKTNFFYVNILLLKIVGIFCPLNGTKLIKFLYNTLTFLFISLDIFLILTEFLYFFTISENLLSAIINNIYIILLLLTSLFKTFYLFKNKSKILEVIRKCSVEKWCVPNTPEEEALMKKWYRHSK